MTGRRYALSLVGLLLSQFALGQQLSVRDMPSLRTEASEPAVQNIDATAAYQRAMTHILGITADHDYARAAEDLRQAATTGLSTAEVALGYLYENGFGVQRDYRLAMSYYRAAADQGSGLAANNIGALYEWGRGISSNLSEAARWYRIAAERGDPTGQTNLAALFSTVEVFAATTSKLPTGCEKRWIKVSRRRSLCSGTYICWVGVCRWISLKRRD